MLSRLDRLAVGDRLQPHLGRSPQVVDVDLTEGPILLGLRRQGRIPALEISTFERSGEAFRDVRFRPAEWYRPR